ncbi:NADH dehydrogenase [ubiquinone] 1 beta subcomplex subunit 5, mitochondrial-like [Crassostrea virginica]
MIPFSCLRVSMTQGARNFFTLVIRTPQTKNEALKSKPVQELVRSSHWGPGFLGVPRFGTRIKDYFLRDHIILYFWIAAAPVSLMTMYNMYIGPAELKDIPEGYEPRHWEYYRTPAQRFAHKWIFSSYEQGYEKNLHVIDQKLRKAYSKRRHKIVDQHMRYNFEYKGWYYQIDRRIEDLLLHEELQKKHGIFKEYFYGRPLMDRSQTRPRN